MYNASFERFSDAVWQSRDKISKDRHPVICNPPYITLGISHISNLNNGRPSPQDMKLFLKILFALVDLGAHEPMFCLVLKRKKWDVLLVN